LHKYIAYDITNIAIEQEEAQDRYEFIINE